jgi:hypothetical protein
MNDGDYWSSFTFLPQKWLIFLPALLNAAFLIPSFHHPIVAAKLRRLDTRLHSALRSFEKRRLPTEIDRFKSQLWSCLF